MEEKTMSVREALEITLRDLKAIWVPVSMANEIARPIWNVTQKLQDIIKGLQEAEETEEVKEDV